MPRALPSAIEPTAMIAGPMTAVLAPTMMIDSTSVPRLLVPSQCWALGPAMPMVRFCAVAEDGAISGPARQKSTTMTIQAKLRPTITNGAREVRAAEIGPASVSVTAAMPAHLGSAGREAGKARL